MKGFLAIGLAVLAFLGLLSVAVFFGAGFYLSPQDELKKASVIVAISGGETDSRVEEAIQIYRDGWAPNLIFSGAARDPGSPSNAASMRRQAMAAGIPANRIFLEEKAISTKQNAERSADIIKQHGWSTVILVTSPYHQRRAYISFNRALGDHQIINHSAKDHSWRRSKWWANPKSFALTMSELQKTVFLLLGGNPV